MTTPQLTAQRISEIVQALPALVCVDGNPDSLTHEHFSSLLHDYYRVVEIAHFVRRGGVKAMIYRLETGHTKFVPVDYFDEAHARLEQASGRRWARAESPQAAHSLLARLKSVSEEEEMAVKSHLVKLDAFLINSSGTKARISDELRHP